MSAADKKAPGRDPEALHNTIAVKHTTIRGRRALTRLWAASRAVAGAAALGVRP